MSGAPGVARLLEAERGEAVEVRRVQHLRVEVALLHPRGVDEDDPVDAERGDGRDDAPQGLRAGHGQHQRHAGARRRQGVERHPEEEALRALGQHLPRPARAPAHADPERLARLDPQHRPRVLVPAPGEESRPVVAELVGGEQEEVHGATACGVHGVDAAGVEDAVEEDGHLQVGADVQDVAVGRAERDGRADRPAVPVAQLERHAPVGEDGLVGLPVSPRDGTRRRPGAPTSCRRPRASGRRSRRGPPAAARPRASRRSAASRGTARRPRGRTCRSCRSRCRSPGRSRSGGARAPRLARRRRGPAGRPRRGSSRSRSRTARPRRRSWRRSGRREGTCRSSRSRRGRGAGRSCEAGGATRRGSADRPSPGPRPSPHREPAAATYSPIVRAPRPRIRSWRFSRYFGRRSSRPA